MDRFLTVSAPEVVDRRPPVRCHATTEPPEAEPRPTHMRERLLPVLIGAVLASAVAACGASDDSGVAGGSTPTSSSPTVAPSRTTLQGILRKGVEPGCLILRSSGKTYGLINDRTRQLPIGAHIEVTGTTSPERASSCMQGTPFVVTHVKVLD